LVCKALSVLLRRHQRIAGRATPTSRSLRYTAPGARALHLSWQGLPQLGLWTRAGGEFLCVEPWHGYHSPPGWDGAFTAKPGLAHLAPGASQDFSLVIRPE
jgi:galactose mutarotase-like enzyme